MFSLGCGSYLLQVLPRVGPELCLQNPSIGIGWVPSIGKQDGQGFPGPPSVSDPTDQTNRYRTVLDQSPSEKSQGMREGHTFTPGQGVVPVAVGAMLTCKDRLAHQLISWEALEGH